MPRPPPRHDHDAGGDEAVLAAKAALRVEVWSAMAKPGIGRFPGAEGRIPNFVGAEAAADRLRATEPWGRAARMKANPDSPQLPVRRRALEDGKTVFMAVPRLAADKPFLVLDPESLRVPARRAASIKGASAHGRPVEISELEPVDLAVVGCVAVSEDGARLGKGGGFADLEYALAWEAGLLNDATIVATTVHEAQVLDGGRIPETAHDFRLDLVVTPQRVIACRRGDRRRRSPGIRWEVLTGDKVAAIPCYGACGTPSTREKPGSAFGPTPKFPDVDHDIWASTTSADPASCAGDAGTITRSEKGVTRWWPRSRAPSLVRDAVHAARSRRALHRGIASRAAGGSASRSAVCSRAAA